MLAGIQMNIILPAFLLGVETGLILAMSIIFLMSKLGRGIEFTSIKVVDGK